jgi:hypothetical protein
MNEHLREQWRRAARRRAAGNTSIRGMDVGDGIHRGISVRLSPEDHAVVHDESRPLGERAHHLMDAVTREGYEPLGQHWATDPHQGQHFSQQYGGHDGGKTNVIFHASTPEHDDIEHDAAWREEHEVNDMEDEVPLRRGADVEVHGVSWREHTPPGGKFRPWNHHRLTEPQWHTASGRR